LVFVSFGRFVFPGVNVCFGIFERVITTPYLCSHASRNKMRSGAVAARK
jgi:hypothetical protein